VVSEWYQVKSAAGGLSVAGSFANQMWQALEGTMTNALGKYGAEVEVLDEGPAVTYTDLLEDVREVILDSVLGDI
jgi:hypothetical protein